MTTPTQARTVAERLRDDAKISGDYYGKLPLEAAALIEELTEALEPFARHIRLADDGSLSDDAVIMPGKSPMTLADLRRARTAYLRARGE